MKKLIPLLLLFTFTTICSQEYHFDYLIESQTTRTKPNEEKIVSTSYYDAKNKVSLSITKYDEILRASIYDDDKKLRHLFKVTQDKGSFLFQYMHTNDFNEDKKRHLNEDILEVSQIDSLQYQIIAFKNEKRTKKRFTAIVTLEKSKFNYLEIHVDHAKSKEMEEKIKSFLDPNSNYSTKKMHVNYHSTGYVYDNLLKIRNIDFSLKVPEKLIIKEYDFFGEFQ